MSAAQIEQEAGREALTRGERAVLLLYIVSALAVFVLMMLLGLTMRAAQATWVGIAPNVFYQVMTAHGAGMVGTVGLATSVVMWFFLRKYVQLSLAIYAANYVLFLLGALAILGAVFIGGYAGAWTFLYPLPVRSMNLWSPHAAALFMLGYLLIGVGFLLFYLDAMRAIIRVYGNLGRALGLQWLFGGEIDKSHPKTVVASTMVAITNSIGILAGAVVLVMCLVNIYFPALALNALLVKNLTYLFGHMFINAGIYMGVIAVYELLPRYTGRPYPISRPFLWSWAASHGDGADRLPASPDDGLRDAALDAGDGPGHLVLRRAAGVHRDRLRRADQRLSLGHALDHAGQAADAVDVRLGRRHRAGDHRWHDQRQQADAQHAVGARALPFLSAAGRAADGAGADVPRHRPA